MTSDSITPANEQTAASELGLPLRFEVVLDVETDQRLHRLMHGNLAAREMAAFWLRNLLCYVGMALGIYGSLMGGMVFVACMILTLGVALFLQHRILAKSLSDGVAKEQISMRVGIEITEEGIIEVDRGVESRFGWSAMNQWFLADAILYIQLKNGKWAVLPEKGMEPATIPLERLGSMLQIKGVPGRQITL